jgi:hypothetical protein
MGQNYQYSGLWQASGASGGDIWAKINGWVWRVAAGSRQGDGDRAYGAGQWRKRCSDDKALPGRAEPLPTAETHFL